MIETFMSLEAKDKFTTIGIVITALLTLLNIVFTLYNNKKNLYANTILKERLDSLNKLKVNSAKLLSIINDELRCMNKFEKSYKEIFELKSMVIYQFNYNDKEEQKKSMRLTI
ncbi:hypothetical protein P9436_06590 [Lysinibacillus capsici]|uniref:hypothetical protein n=1 Tax=Lysinibacillus capsici TaxID=2115968 RepID=UPI002E1C1AAA|nr:hypothetical protein [Lysinibacillus capsici]